MLAADRATKPDRVTEYLRHSFVHPMDFVWVPLIGEEKGMQVTVTEVTDVPTVSLYLSAVF
jgi:hypothetical protein